MQDAKPDDGTGPNNATTTASDVAEAPTAPPPAPPSIGAPPPPGPPPPPMGGPGAPPVASLLPKRKIQKPSIKLKGYQWVKLPDAKIKNTVWGGFDFQKQIRFDWNEIEEIFAANPLPTKERSSGPFPLSLGSPPPVVSFSFSLSSSLFWTTHRVDHREARGARSRLERQEIAEHRYRAPHSLEPSRGWWCFG